MRRRVIDIESRRPQSSTDELMERLSNLVVGQSAAVGAVVPYVQMYLAGLSPDNRPAGVFLLLGPTGTGKTRTVAAIAEILHGNPQKLLRIDCGEFQLDHEAAKLTGAPPGYLGHRETQPLLTQARINGVASDYCSLSLILFDEIEKASPSLMRLLLGVTDRASLRLGDNNSVNFERTMIFLTSNLGAQKMMEELRGRMGFGAHVPVSPKDRDIELDKIAQNAARRHFSPEFINRMDGIVTYRPLEAAALTEILDQQLAAVQKLVNQRLAPGAFRLQVTDKAKRFLLKRGVSPEYGAREMKRVIHRHVLQPMATLVADNLVPPGAVLRIDAARDQERLTLTW